MHRLVSLQFSHGKELSSPFYGTWYQVPRLSCAIFFTETEIPMNKGKKITLKQILALGAVVLLVALYLSCLILALFHNDAAAKLLQLALVLTVLIPVTAYVLMMFYKLSRRKDDESKF